MSRILAFIFVLSGVFQLSAQVDVQFVDPQQKPIAGVVLVNYVGKEFGPSDAKGWIRKLPPEAGSVLQAFKEGYYLKSLQIDGAKSTVFQVVLQPNDIALAEVTVSAKSLSFTDTLRVLDFDFQDTLVLVLGYDYMVLANLNLKPIATFRNKQDFRSIERDVQGNLFLLSKDSVSEVFLRARHALFYPAVSIEQYQTYIEPLAAVIGGSMVLRNNRFEQMPLPISPMRPGNQGKSMSFPPFHNQGVQFYIYRKAREPEPFYFSVDTAALMLAHDAFMDAYSIAASMEKYFDEFGIWQHEKLFDIDQALKIYRMYYAKPLPIPIVKQGNQYWLFDRFIDQVVVFDNSAREVAHFPFTIDDDFLAPLILLDPKTERLYALKEKRGMVFLHPIKDQQIQMGTKVSLFARETKVWQNTLYYIDEHKKMHFRPLP